MHRALQPSANSFPTSQRRTPAPHTPHHRPHQHQRHGRDDEDRLISVVKKKGGGTVLLTVEYAYCPACGGSRTHKIVYSGEKSDANRTKWLQYETEGLNQLRVDERWDSNGSGTITEADQWRTQRVSYNGYGQIQQLLKEVIYDYPSSTTNTVSSKATVYFHYDLFGTSANISGDSGTTLESYETDAFGVWDGGETYTNRRITGKEYDSDIELYYFSARWFHADSGRFVSADALNGTRHDYTFCNANPMMFVDPLGLYAGVRVKRAKGIIDSLHSIPIDAGHEWLVYPGGSKGFWPNEGWVVRSPDPAETTGVAADRIWKTKKKESGWIEFGANKKRCTCANESDVLDCVKAAGDPGWRSVSIFSNCRRYVTHVLTGCCLLKDGYDE